jgi:hypothetical protein
MRTITAAAQAVLDGKTGIEPIIAVDIQWTLDGAWYQYAEKEITVSGRTIKGTVNQVAGLDNTIVIQSVMTGTAGDSQSLTITLDDTSGQIKNIVMGNDVHKRSVKVYLYLDGTDFDADRIWLFTGELSTPIEWDEGTQTVSVNIINKIEDAEVGFSIEEGDFYLPPQELIGVPWPLCFGRCINIPAMRVKSPVRGILKTGFGIADFILPHLAKQIEAVCCPLVFNGYRAFNDPGSIYHSLKIEATYVVDAACWCKKLADATAAREAYELQKQYEYEELVIAGGEQFPQQKRIWLEADGAKIYGYFNGTTYARSSTFKVLKYVHPKVDEIEIPQYYFRFQFCSNLASRFIGLIGEDKRPSYREPAALGLGVPNCGEQGAESQNVGWDYVASYPRADFFWVQPGTEVYQADSDGDSVHVVNLLPSTIHRVAGWKQYDMGVRELATIPPSYYTTRASNFNGYLVAEVVLKKNLRFYDEGWEGDKIYVSFTSSIGPNMVDEMIWLINKYTNLSYDAANFADVKSKLTVYRNNYPILERKNILEVLRTMAFNNRCALILRDNEFKLIYLSEDPTSVMTITESDIVPKTLKIGHTSTEELVTKVNGIWRDDYAYPEKKYISRFNVKKYGTMEETFEFPCFNIYAWVVKSNTFWMIRMANTWKRISFTTYMDKIALEVLDAITVDLPALSSSPVKCIVENATYNSSDYTVDIEAWTPIRAGETEASPFVWPQGIRVDKYWPSAEDIAQGFGGGSGPNVDVRAPNLHPLSATGIQGVSGFSMNSTEAQGPCDSTSTAFRPPGCRPDHGDTQPSDLDDKDINPKIPGEDDDGEAPDGKGGYGKVSSESLQNERNRDQEEEDKGQDIATTTEVQSGVTKAPAPDPNELCENVKSPEDAYGYDKDDPDSSKPDCIVVVTVGYLRPVNRVIESPGGIPVSDPGATGQAVQDEVFGPDDLNEYWFNSLEAAKGFAATMQQMAESYSAVVGANWPARGTITYHVQGRGTWAFGKHDNGRQDGEPTGEDCEEPDNPGMTAMDESAGGGPGGRSGGDMGLCDELNPNGAQGGPTGTTMDWINTASNFQ